MLSSLTFMAATLIRLDKSHEHATGDTGLRGNDFWYAAALRPSIQKRDYTATAHGGVAANVHLTQF